MTDNISKVYAALRSIRYNANNGSQDRPLHHRLSLIANEADKAIASIEYATTPAEVDGVGAALRALEQHEWFTQDGGMRLASIDLSNTIRTLARQLADWNVNGPALAQQLELSKQREAHFTAQMMAARNEQQQAESQLAEATRRLAALEGQAAALPADQCRTCNGHGMIGGFVNADSGYQSDPCPDCAAPPAVPEGMVLVPREIVDRFPEINVSNYDHDDACALNAWGVELVLAATPAHDQPEGEEGGWMQAAALLAVPEAESVTLTVAQIAHLASFAGLILAQSPQPAPDELEAEITVCTCPEKGVLLDGEDTDPGMVAHYKHIAYYSEYPDEGCIGLGAELAATPAHDQPEGSDND